MIDIKNIPDSKRYSVIHDMSRCIVCGKPKDHIHEVFGGTERKASKYFGMCVGLCYECHEKVHQHKKVMPTDKKDIDTRLKELSQEVFEYNHSREDFIKYFHRSYL